MTNRVNVQVEDEDFGNWSLRIFVDIDSGEEDGVCEDVTAAGAAIAGAVNGVAGSIFSLASLTCDA